MTDTNIGFIWNRDWLPGRHSETLDLIRKLVEERANSYCEDMPTCHNKKTHILEALHDFGIDPKTYL